ncbi:MAG: signal peptidase II [Gemmatimonadaceae bacterium]
MPKTPPHLSLLAQIALVVAIGDLGSKSAAASLLSGTAVELTNWLRLAVVRNDQGAFGISFGAYTRQLNLALTLSAIGLMVPVSRDLARVDRLAPYALGLIVGGALGNLTSLIVSPHGVVDFIAVRTGQASALVLNVADLAAYSGLALLCRTGFLLVSRIRAEAQPIPVLTSSAPAFTLIRTDREVPIPLAADGGKHPNDFDLGDIPTTHLPIGDLPKTRQRPDLDDLAL